MKKTLYQEVMDKKTEREQLMLISKQRKYIKDYLDAVNLKYASDDITLIREQLEYGYRAIDVVIAYAQVYRTKHDNVENKHSYTFSNDELETLKECVQIAHSDYDDLPYEIMMDIRKKLNMIK